jgi:hypothetical protein
MSKAFHNNLLIVNTSVAKNQSLDIQDDLAINAKDNESLNLERMSSMGNDVSHSLSKSFFDKEKDGEMVPVLSEIDFPIDDHRHSTKTNERPIKLLNKVPILQKNESDLVKHIPPTPIRQEDIPTTDGHNSSNSHIEKDSRKKIFWKDNGPAIEVSSLVHRVNFEPFINQPANLHLEAKRQEREGTRPRASLVRVLRFSPTDAEHIPPHHQN